jgi:hypothetical protein
MNVPTGGLLAVAARYLLHLNGLPVSEACAASIEDLRLERGHRTLRLSGRGTSLRPFRTSRTIDLAIGERNQGPILRRREGQRLDRRTAQRWVRSIGERAGLVAVHAKLGVASRAELAAKAPRGQRRAATSGGKQRTSPLVPVQLGLARRRPNRISGRIPAT